MPGEPVRVQPSWAKRPTSGGASFDWTDEDPTGPAGTTIAGLLGEHPAEMRRCDAVVAAADSLDVVSAHRDVSLRRLLLRLVEETARHLGHIGPLREQADGSAGEQPEEQSAHLINRHAVAPDAQSRPVWPTAEKRSVQTPVEADGDRAAGILADPAAQLRRDGELVGPVAQRHRGRTTPITAVGAHAHRPTTPPARAAS